MSKIILDKLIVSGGGHTDSVIEFKPGANFILGPSNTGKSLVMDCLDYALGFIPKKDKPSKIVNDSHGYEKITLCIKTDNGSVSLTRKIGDSKINVGGTDHTVEHGNYSVSHTAKKNINSVLLQLIGIDEAHKIRSAEEGSKTQALTFRSFMHLFFIKQGDVARESSALLAPGGLGHTASAAALLFLLTGQDASDLNAEEDPEISKAKRKALINYISDKLASVISKREEIEAAISAAEGDPDSDIESIRQSIAELQGQLDNATQQSRKIMSSIYALNSKLSETRTVSYNFSVLRKQYQSDIKRIGFIVDGAANTELGKHTVKCPICGEETEIEQDSKFIASSTSELEKIKRHLTELGTAQQSIDQQEDKILNSIKELESQKDAVDALINNQLLPKLSAFQKRLDERLKVVQLSGEIEALKRSETAYRTELFNKENEEPVKPTKHNIRSDYDYALIQSFEEILKEILKESKIGGASTARFNMDTFDIEIEQKGKSISNGGGYCGILNTITTLAMTKYMLDKDCPVPGFYAVDSSLTQLSEAEHKEQSETTKKNFTDYLIKHALERQVIIVEQTKRMPYVPEENEKKGVHVIRFSHDKTSGRYGFLNEVFNPEDM